MPSAPPSPSAPPRRRRGARRLAGRLLAVVLALVLADVAASLTLLRHGTLLGRPLPPFRAITDARQAAWVEGLASREGTDIGRFDRDLGWTWIPDSASADGDFHIGHDGARGTRAYAPTPPPGTLRVLAFGDSFTFCDEIPDAKSFEAQLEERHHDLEVMNFGVGGYGTDQALLRFRALGRGRGARVVLIGILLENIGRNVNRFRPLWNPMTGFCATKPRFVLAAEGGLELLPQPFADRLALRAALLDGSVLERIRPHEYWIDRPPVPTGRLSAFVRILAGAWAYHVRSPERLWQEPGGEPFRVTVALLEAFHREALAAGAEAAPVLLFPSKEDLYPFAREGRRYWDGLIAALEARGIPLVDLTVPLADAQGRIDRGEWDAGLYWGGHLSGAGNHVVALALERWLQEHGYL